MGFVFIIYSLVIIYSDDNMFGDLNIIRFIPLVLVFVVSIIFLIFSPNVINILLGWDGLGLVSCLLVIYYQNVRCATGKTFMRTFGLGINKKQGWGKYTSLNFINFRTFFLCLTTNNNTT